MPDNKRTFEAQILKITPIHSQAKAKAETRLSVPNKDQLGTQHFSFSKDIILRLIEWFEKE
jgi:uncharacterized protein YlaI